MPNNVCNTQGDRQWADIRNRWQQEQEDSRKPQVAVVDSRKLQAGRRKPPELAAE